MFRRIRGFVACTIVAGAVLLGGATGAHAAPIDNARATTADARIKAAKDLATRGLIGANDWSCKPSAEHPRPVILVHGTFATGTLNWVITAPLLASRGYCVFSLTYGSKFGLKLIGGIESVESSAAQLSTFVDGVLAATGATKVDMVGHSQGGMMPRQYLRFLGGAAKVNTLVGLAPSNYGGTPEGFLKLALSFPGATEILHSACHACRDQTAGSPFLTRLNEGSDTVAGVNYVVLATRYDELLPSLQSQFLKGAHARNILVQDLCPSDTSGHVTLAYDPVVLHEVLNHLDPANATPTGCTR